MAKYIVGSDIGGTFTDLIAIDLDTGKQLIAKVLSTPPLYVDGLINGLRKAGIKPSEVVAFRHGATISTNAIIQRKGAKTGLVVTEGFKGIFIGGRSERMGAFELNWDPPDPLIRPRDTFGVRERVNINGEIVAPLHEEDVVRAARIFKKRGMQSIAVCYMQSFMNATHEKRTKEILQQECPGMYISISTEVLPRMLEFERCSTTVLNAYLGPIMEEYLSELKKRLAEWGYAGATVITHSGGGVMGVEAALRLPVRSCHSSPVSGVVGLATYIGKLTGHENVLAFESGGTTNDVSMVYQGQPATTIEWRILWNAPCCLPSIETTYVGAGGGSIAWVDKGGAIRVGPHSAGASPGPACFGFGGTEPTSTDVQMVLGRLNPRYFLGGEIKIHPDLARKAVKETIADKFGWTIEEAGDAVYKIAISNLMVALRLQTVSRGWDPRDFAMVAYGGSGPMYAVDLARELECPLVIIPPLPGYASAFGAMRVDLVQDFMTPIMKTESELDFSQLNNIFREMEADAHATLNKEGIPKENQVIKRLADVKYFDQSRYLTVDVPPGKISDFTLIADRYRAAMKQVYGYILPPGFVELELVNLRVVASGLIPKPELPTLTRPRSAEVVLKEKRDVYFGEAGGWVEAAIYERGALPPGAVINGPSIVEQPDSTTVLPPGSGARVDDYGNLLITPAK